MKTALLTIAAITLASGTAFAAPMKNYKPNYGRGHITPYERVLIANSAKKVSMIKVRAWRDGRLTFFERYQIRNAERRHAALVARLRRS